MSNKKLHHGVICAAMGLVGTASIAGATEISTDLIWDSTLPSSFIMSGSTVAGPAAVAEPGATWNNLWTSASNGSTVTWGGGNSGWINVGGATSDSSYTTTTSMYDSDGNATNLVASVKFGYPSTNGSSGTAGTAEDHLLYSTGLGGSPSVSQISLSLSSIPYASYSVYVYFEASGATGNDATVSDPLAGGGTGTTYYYANSADETSSGFPGYQLVDSSSSADNYESADYAIFSGETSSSLQIAFSAGVGTTLSGFQIVQTPEPASAAVLGVVGLAAMLRRRRAQSQLVDRQLPNEPLSGIRVRVGGGHHGVASSTMRISSSVKPYSL